MAKCKRPAWVSVKGQPLCEHHWEKHLRDADAAWKKEHRAELEAYRARRTEETKASKSADDDEELQMNEGCPFP